MPVFAELRRLVFSAVWGQVLPTLFFEVHPYCWFLVGFDSGAGPSWGYFVPLRPATWPHAYHSNLSPKHKTGGCKSPAGPKAPGGWERRKPASWLGGNALETHPQTGETPATVPKRSLQPAPSTDGLTTDAVRMPLTL